MKLFLKRVVCSIFARDVHVKMRNVKCKNCKKERNKLLFNFVYAVIAYNDLLANLAS